MEDTAKALRDTLICSKVDFEQDDLNAADALFAIARAINNQADAIESVANAISRLSINVHSQE